MAASAPTNEPTILYQYPIPKTTQCKHERVLHQPVIYTTKLNMPCDHTKKVHALLQLIILLLCTLRTTALLRTHCICPSTLALLTHYGPAHVSSSHMHTTKSVNNSAMLLFFGPYISKTSKFQKRILLAFQTFKAFGCKKISFWPFKLIKL